MHAPAPLPGVFSSADYRADRREEVDVLVIGTGCGGATAAANLAAKGRQVLMVEQGRYRTSREFTMRELDMYGKLYANGGMTGPEDLSTAILYGETVGGSSIHYMANSFRAPAKTLDRWRREHGVEGMSAEDLAPYYATLEERHSVHPAHAWEINRNNQLFRAGCEALGWRSGPMPHARKDCANLGFCLLGCPADRKQSQLLTHIPMALANGARLYADARVEHLLIEGGRAAGATCALLSADRQPTAKLQVRAKAVILAAGGVGTPALLLRQSLANRSGQVGKNFQITPHFFVIGKFNEQVKGWYGMPAGWHCTEWSEVNPAGEGGYMIQGIFAQPAMIGQIAPGFGDAHRDLMETLPTVGALLSLIDDEEPGEISLKADGRPRIDYLLRGRDVAKARDFLKKAAHILLAAGAEYALIPDPSRMRLAAASELGRVDDISFAPGRVPYVGTSNLGTCRMGTDPLRSVVDSWCQAHDVRGLYLTDASVFPSAFSVDPSLTVMANSLRVSDRLHTEI